ncbi:endonuclease/exonuclease/phosphatase family protein [Streptomyces sp. NPDC085481]|uniref:endonuclease/exonuclease/phosphatase family protein n=1 Tax=Streptomyces sp. NPDC085481 TaxID=3365727 RepID=UPI0037D07EF1
MEPPVRPAARPGRRVAAWAAWLLLVVPTLTTGCRLLDSDGFTPVPQFLSLLPWLTVPAGLALLLAAFARRRVLAAWAAVVVAVTAWFVQPYGADGTTARGPLVARVRVLASNVEFGQATEALIEAVRKERPQLAYVSECDPACGRALAAALGAELPYRTAVESTGSRGSVLLSARPLRNPRAVPGRMGMPGADTELGGRTVHLQLAHPLPPVPRQVHLWERESARIRDYAAAHRDAGPVLLAGDFNASQDHAVLRAVLDAGRLHDAARLAGRARTPTWPQGSPVPPYVQIDHVLVSDDFRVRGVRFLSLAGTDHRAVLADLDLHAAR